MAVNLIFKVLLGIFAYLFGSFPTAFVIYKLHKGEDIRNHGSGNVGGTNVLRTAGAGYGILTMAVDMLKGFIPVLLIYLFFPSSYILYVITTTLVIIGHVFPVFLKFRGGKGISTGYGLIAATCILPFSAANLILRLLPAIVLILTVIIIFFSTRIMSLGSITAAILSPVMFFAGRYDNYIIAASVIWSVIVLVSHRDNIKRLFKGQEKKILNKKKEG